MITPQMAEELDISTDWPVAELPDIQAQLCVDDSDFAMETVPVRGIPTRVWKNAVDTLPNLARHARSHGDAVFTIYNEERVSYESWFRATAQLAQNFLSRGIQKGDRIALAMRNLPEWPVVFFAAHAVGAIIVPLNAWWKGEELSYGLENSGAKILVCDVERYGVLQDHLGGIAGLEHVIVSRMDKTVPNIENLETIIGTPHDYGTLPDQDLPAIEMDTDDDATIFYTSGTTGQPKGAVGTHRNMLTNILCGRYAQVRTLARRGEEVPEPEPKCALLVIPLFHVTACNARLMGTIFGGHSLVFVYRWDTVEAFKIIEREKVSSTGGVPTIAWQLLEHPERENYDLSSLEGISYGGAPAAPELVRKIRTEFGAFPGTGWGMTETSATVTAHGAEDYLNRPDSCGPPVPVADLKIMSVDGKEELPIGEIGELWARGPMIVTRYWKKPEASAETFIDGWVRTGDIARLDEAGFCYICDRMKDVIIRAGENIYSTEVENVLYDHPAVTDVALIGLPHRTLGEEPAAAVHLAPGQTATEEELKKFVKDRLASFKTPVKILFFPETLPRNANGKILKMEVKKLFESMDT